MANKQVFPLPPREWDPRWGAELIRALEQLQLALLQPASKGWSVSNLTTDRSYDADATSTAELADVLGTLITDLKNRGILAGNV